MKSCLVSVFRTHWAGVVIPLQLEILSSKDVAHIKHIHHEQPCKDSNFVGEF
jgi:hypothetical protein